MRWVILVFILILINISTFFGFNNDYLYIISPAISLTLVLFFSITHLIKKDREFPLFDIGMICIFFTYVYSFYPLINYMAGGFNFVEFSDSRLLGLNINSYDLGLFELRNVLYMLMLSISYCSFRKISKIEFGCYKLKSVDIISIILLIIIIKTLLIIFEYLWGININPSYDELFGENIEKIKNLPLIISQIFFKFIPIYFLLKLAFYFICISNYKDLRWRYIGLIFLFVDILDSIATKGSRATLIFTLIFCFLCFYKLVKKIKVDKVIIYFGLLISAFLLLGIYRENIDLMSMIAQLTSEDGGVLTRTNEFQALLGTAYHTKILMDNGLETPWYLYFNDIIAVLPPQQLLPFSKISGAEWYISVAGYEGANQGYMWGVIAQSLAGFDWLELAIRAIFLGFILAKYHNWYCTNQKDPFNTIFYCYMCTRIYYTYRDTTLGFLPFIIWEIIPCLLFIWITKYLLMHLKYK